MTSAAIPDTATLDTATLDTATLDTAVRWRRDLHRLAEVGFAEHHTADYVAQVLEGVGLTVTRGVGGTGIVASLRRGASPRAIGLRADMDALALHEHADRPYRSTSPGVMHACGHDGHMAMLLATAAALATDLGVGFDGTVRFIFQPAEEHGRGAKAMLDDALLDRFPIEAIFGLHNMPGIASGAIHTRAGALMAGEDNFEIRVHGRGGHAARPHMVIDPLVVGAEIVLALQTVVSRAIDPSRSAVVSCTEFHTDGTRNAIPGEAIIRGDTRSFDPEVSAQIEACIRRLCAGVAQAHGATCTVAYTREFVPTVNDAGCAALATSAAIAALGAAAVEGDCTPIMASEDFAVLAAAVPGCFAFIGNGIDQARGGTPLHNTTYDFNDAIIPNGVAYYRQLVRLALPVTPADPS